MDRAVVFAEQTRTLAAGSFIWRLCKHRFTTNKHILVSTRTRALKYSKPVRILCVINGTATLVTAKHRITRRLVALYHRL